MQAGVSAGTSNLRTNERSGFGGRHPAEPPQPTRRESPVRRIIVTGILIAAVAGGAGSALAGGKSGPNGHNNYGLCKAYFSGSENGQNHKHNSTAFQALEAAADDGDDSTSPAEDVMAFCDGATPGGK